MSSLAVLFTPYMASADGWDWGGRNRHPHRKIDADQMATSGFAAATVLGAVGYLVLRRRKDAAKGIA